MTITANRDERAVFARLAEAYGTPSVSEALRKAAFREAELLGLTPRGKGK